MDPRLKTIDDYLNVSVTLQQRVGAQCGAQILAASTAIASALQAGNKVMMCGNGGSAADCQHMATELVSRLSAEFERPPIAAIALTTDTSVLTAYANDYGFDGVFQRQLEAIGREGDVLVGISTSGRSENVRRAVRMAKAMSIATVGLMGSGGPLEQEVDHAVVIPSIDTQRIQEALLPVEHLVCLLIEQALFGQSTATRKQ